MRRTLLVVLASLGLVVPSSCAIAEASCARASCHRPPPTTTTTVAPATTAPASSSTSSSTTTSTVAPATTTTTAAPSWPPGPTIDCGGGVSPTITLSQVDGAVIRNCVFVNDFVQLWQVTNATVTANTFVSTDGIDRGQQLADLHGVGNRLVGNRFDGGGAYDDNLIADDVRGDTITDNVAVGAWDCAIETAYDVTDTLIARNDVTGGRLCAIGGWKWSSLLRVTIDGNTLRASPTFNTLYGINFENSYGAYTADTVRFEHVAITNNVGGEVHVFVGQVAHERDPATFAIIDPPDDRTCADPATNVYAGNTSQNIYTYSWGCP